MPFTIERARAGSVIATERTYVDAEGNIVGPDDPNRVTLVAAAGAPVPQEYEAACAAQVREEQAGGGQIDNTLPPEEKPPPGTDPPLGGSRQGPGRK
jgi:hypothetical protein